MLHRSPFLYDSIYIIYDIYDSYIEVHLYSLSDQNYSSGTLKKKKSNSLSGLKGIIQWENWFNATF